MGATVGDVLTNVGAGAVGGWLGSELGKAIFDDAKNKGIGATAGGVVGSYWGPWGSAIGAFIGGLGESALGLGSNKNMTAGFATTQPGDNVTQEITLPSGLKIWGISKGTGDEGEGTNAFMDLAQGVDAQLVNTAAQLGIDIQLSNEGFGGEVVGKGNDLNKNPTFFGSHQKAGAEGKKIPGQLEDGMASFVSSWFEQAADQFPPEFRDQIAALPNSGSAEEMVNQFGEIALAMQVAGYSPQNPYAAPQQNVSAQPVGAPIQFGSASTLPVFDLGNLINMGSIV
jgi:hypothetical protein